MIRWTHRSLDFDWFHHSSETDLGDARAGVESDCFSKRHAEDKMREHILRFHALIPARPGQ